MAARLFRILGPLLVTLVVSAGPVVAAERPNVLLIMTDDQGWGDVRSHDNPLIDTPTLDRLAADGARFERFFVSPVCAPTRASLLTGRVFLRTGVHGVTRAEETMREDEVTMAEVFRAAGYATGCFGKWHNGAHYPHHPNGQGFEEFLGFCAGHWNNYFDTQLEHNGQMVATDGYITDVLTDAAIQFIDQHRDQPFLCYVPYNAPHSPWQVPESYFDKYKRRGLDDETACAYAMCENIDDNVARLLQALRDRNLEQGTIVLFLTDNGPNGNRYNGDMRGRKGSVDEGGVRVPLFVRWTGTIEPGRRLKPIAAHIDLLPTLVDLCQLNPPEHPEWDGISLAGLLLGTTDELPDRMLFTHRGQGDRGAVRTQRWRAVDDGRSWKLYDMQADPRQEQDLAGNHPRVLAELKTAYQKSLNEFSEQGFATIATQVGHPQARQVWLPGHEAHLHPERGQGISYDGPNGWANDWITNWTSVDAYPQWPIDVVAAGTYQLALQYRCGPENVGADLRVEVGSAHIEGRISEAFDPSPVNSPDLVPRKEVYEFPWQTLKLGTVQLSAGPQDLRVRLLSKPGSQAIHLKAVILISESAEGKP